jgi:hypothetical protein
MIVTDGGGEPYDPSILRCNHEVVPGVPEEPRCPLGIDRAIEDARRDVAQNRRFILPQNPDLERLAMCPR